jgi:hypothetical protein
MSYHEAIPPTPRKPNVPAVQWNIHIVDEKGDIYNVAFLGTVEQIRMKTEALTEKLETAGLSSTAEVTLVQKGLKVFAYKNRNWTTTIDGLVMGFSHRPITKPLRIGDLLIH